MHAHTSHRRSGFTLIELLTVIAIIGILAAILIPTVTKVRSSARDTQCVSQIRQWGMVIQLHANDNRGTYYVTNWASADPAESSYRRYFANANKEVFRMRICPSDPRASEYLNQTQPPPLYGMVQGSIGGSISNKAPPTLIPLSKARNPSQYLLMTDAISNANVPITGDTLQSITTYLMPLLDSSAANLDRHGGARINAVFGDGSTRKISGQPTRPNDPKSIITMRTTWFQIY